MNFLIADTFTDSLARLTGDEQKATKTTAFDLQLDPSSPGLKFHKLDKAKDKRFWSVRVSSDIRLIVHRSDDSLLLCYVDHHDRAYKWAERRKLQIHPKTGAAQLIEIRETVQESIIPAFVQQSKRPQKTQKPLFAGLSEDELLCYGVPSEWMSDVRSVTEDTLFTLTEHLPSEASEALLELATGGKPRIFKPQGSATSPFEHPDAQRRFRVMSDVDELQRALDFPWEKWTVFLHPEQQQWVSRDFAGPARVSGSAGTGKTIVALHRAVFLAREYPDARVLLTTFSDTLANALQTKLQRLLGNEPRLAERIDVHSLRSIGVRLHRMLVGPVTVCDSALIGTLLLEASKAVQGHKFNMRFLSSEWDEVVDAWQLETWEAYRDVARLGRKTRLPEAQRLVLWSIFDKVRGVLAAKKLATSAAMFTALAQALSKSKNSPFDYAVVDESQDISVSQLRFFAALGADRPNALFFAGDLGQRIFQQPFSWKSLGVDIRGRSKTLRVNYRTSHQIRTQADRLLATEVADVDGNHENRGDTISVFNGPPPIVRTYENTAEESVGVGRWLSEQSKAGVLPHEFGVFVRSQDQIPRAVNAVREAGLLSKILDEHIDTANGHVSICTMHLAKGLEFRAVAVIACDDEIIPLQERIATVADDGDLQEVYDTERHLLYVACTRARDFLLVSGVDPASEFLDDLQL